jgi:DNA-binding NtrC family response regulator
MSMKESSKVIIVGDNYQISKIVLDEKTLLSYKPIRVKHCNKALKVASRHPSFFDLLFTDIMPQEVNGEDFAEQFTKLSPRTKIVYVIL